MTAFLLMCWGGLKSALSAALSAVTRYPLHFIIGALCVAVWWFWDDARDERRAKEAAIAQTEQAIAAGKQAYEAQVALNKATEQRYQENARVSDKRHTEALASANDLAAAHINRNRVRQDGGCIGGQSGSASQDRDTQGGERSGEAPDMVAVTDEDVRICTENTVRIESAREWAAGLNL